MHHRLVCSRVLPALLVAVVVAGQAAASEPSPNPGDGLHLYCETGGGPRPLTAVDGETLLLREGEAMVPAPPAPVARWTLTGDPRVHAQLLAWSPAYSLKRDPTTHALAYRAVVSIDYRHDIAPPAAQMLARDLAAEASRADRPRSALTDHWPEAPNVPSVLVAAWIIDGQFTQVQAVARPHPGADRDFLVQFTFVLTPAEAAGQPAVGLWRRGRFVPPAPFSDHAATDAAYHAVFLDDASALKTAIGRGARLTAKRPSNGATLAHFAAECGAVDSLALLLEKNRKLADALTSAGRTADRWAASKGRTGVLRWWVDNLGLRGGMLSEDRSPTLEEAAESGHGPALEVVGDALVTRGKSSTRILEGAYRRAMQSGCPDVMGIVAAIHRRTAPTEPVSSFWSGAPDRTIGTFVGFAEAGHLPMVEWLIETGDPDLDREANGRTALVAAVAGGHLEIARALLAAGAHPNAALPGGKTPLMAAAWGNRPAMVALLLAAGAHPNATSATGMSALHFAAEQDAVAVAAQLLDAGAAIEICNIREITPLDLALLGGARQTARLLTARGACIGLGARYSADLLTAAVVHDMAPPIATAIEQGWPAGSTFAGVWPALRVAEILGSNEVAGVLRAAGAESSPDRPVPLVPASELDAPLSVASAGDPVDPREPGETFPAVRLRVRLVVDPEGRALFPQVIDAVPPRLSMAVKQAAQQTRFTPPRRGGQPVATLHVHEIELPASRDRVFAAGTISRDPTLRNSTRPYLPESVASRRHLPARVVVEYVVNALGRPEQVKVLESPRQEFTESSLLALSSWTYTPGRHDGRPVAVRMTQTFVFERP